MIIGFRKKYIRTDLIIGSLYILWGVAGIIFQSSSINLFVNVLFLVCGIFFLGSFYYKQKFQYLHIKDSILTCYIFGSKNRSVDLREVSRIKKFADEITFFTTSKKLTISTNQIAKEDLPALIDTLASLDLEPEKNPFIHAA